MTKRQHRWMTLSAAAITGLMAACSTTPAPSIPASLQVPANERLFEVVAARGMQVYECRAKPEAPGGAEWAFVAPEAELLDAQGRAVGRHYAGPHWEASDGSRIKGSVKAKVDAPQAGAIPWLLLSTQAAGPSGRYAAVTSIQRVHTVGGVAPTAGCSTADLGRQAKVPYTADYRLFVRA